jgi:hypothetical protein
LFWDELPVAISYLVVCDAGWLSRRATLRGWRGGSEFKAEIRHTAQGEWFLDGAPVAGLGDCVDLDLGFTPATNLIQVRRIALAVGDAADAPAAWLDLSTRHLERLEQRYERRGETTYWYEARRFEYAALLQVGSDGFIREYPGLWEAEAPS